MSVVQIEPLRFERLPVVCRRIGVGKSTLYRWIEERKFPSPVRLGANSVAWDARSVDDWMRKRIAASEMAA
jgi:prophage regulatory protein